MKIRIAIASATGSAKKRTIPALLDSEIVEIVGVHSRSAEKLQELAAMSSSFHAFESVTEMLDATKPDVLYIGSPPFMHRMQIEAAASRGVHVMCEKPLALSLSDALAVKKIVGSSGITFALAHHLRHQECLQVVKASLASPEFGEIRAAHLQWNFPVNMASPSSKWKFDPNSGISHSFYDPGVHAIDIAVHLWGEPLYVFATGTKHLSTKTYDTVSALLQYSAHTVFLNCSLAQTTIGNDLHIWASEGMIRSRNFFSEAGAEGIEVTTRSGSSNSNFAPKNLYGSEVEAFARQLLASQSPSNTTLEEAIVAMRIMEAISDSIESRHAVSVSRLPSEAGV